MSGAPAAISRLVPRCGRLLLALPLLMGGSVRSDTRVLLDHGRVSIHAESAPLAEILSRFGEVTGTEIIYDSAPPQQLVSVGFETDSEAEGLVRLLEGQGLNYLFRLDPTGRKVEVLFITARAGVAAAAVSPTRTKRSSPPEEPALEDFGQPFPLDAVEAADPSARSGNVPEQAMNPSLAPGPGTAPGASPDMRPSTPGAQLGVGVPALPPSQPQPPLAASYPGTTPTPLPTPSPPSYPDPASYPGSPE